MNWKHVFEEVDDRSCNNDEEDEEGYSFVEETEETVETVTDRDLHEAD